MTYKIGEVIEILRKEYPDISASSLRYWEKVELLPKLSKTKGIEEGHRLYTDKDLEIIRLIKELSLEGYSIKEIQKKIKEEIIDTEKEMKSIKGIFSFKNLISVYRKARELEKDLNEIIFKNKDEINDKWFEYIYTKEVLINLLGAENAEILIDKAERLNLIFPKKTQNGKKYNRMDETILKLFIKYGEEYLDRCKNLYETVKYLKEEFCISLWHIAFTAYISGKMIIFKRLMPFKIKEENRNTIYFLGLIAFLEEIYYRVSLERKQ